MTKSIQTNNCSFCVLFEGDLWELFGSEVELLLPGYRKACVDMCWHLPIKKEIVYLWGHFFNEINSSFCKIILGVPLFPPFIALLLVFINYHLPIILVTELKHFWVARQLCKNKTQSYNPHWFFTLAFSWCFWVHEHITFCVRWPLHF